MNIVVVGQGAREEAIIRTLAKSKKVAQIINVASSINPGIADIATVRLVDYISIPKQIVSALVNTDIAFVIIGPEAPLAAGVVDLLQAVGIPCIGPTADLARIETSKSYCRNLLSSQLPNVLPLYKTFYKLDGVSEFLNTLSGQCVIKADGLMGGKGVYVAGEHFQTIEQALVIAKTLLAHGAIVIEEKCIGQEFSLMSFCDGKDLIHMPLVQDNKRAYEGDMGPNTGGMGSISYADHRLPFVTKQLLEQAQQTSEKTTALLLADNQQPYCGFLYGGYMVTATGLKLIEFNARLGDPEAINLLALLENDLSEICQAMLTQKLSEIDVTFKQQATVCKYVVPKGYPDNPQKGVVDFAPSKAIYCAAIEKEANVYRLLGSRALACLGVANTLAGAELLAEQTANSIVGDVFYRKDIGTDALLAQKQAQVVSTNA